MMRAQAGSSGHVHVCTHTCTHVYTYVCMCMCSGRSPKVVQKHAPGSDQGARSMSLDTGKGISLIIEC